MISRFQSSGSVRQLKGIKGKVIPHADDSVAKTISHQDKKFVPSCPGWGQSKQRTYRRDSVCHTSLR